jgi:hypothetical protein
MRSEVAEFASVRTSERGSEMIWYKSIPLSQYSKIQYILNSPTAILSRSHKLKNNRINKYSLSNSIMWLTQKSVSL